MKRISIKQLTLSRLKVTQLYKESNETQRKELLKAVNYSTNFPIATTPKAFKYYLRKDNNINKFFYILEEYITPLMLIFAICYFTIHLIIF